MQLLDNINSPEDLKDCDLNHLKQLAREIRQYLIDSVSHTGGHLASNLGTVELILALHYCYDSPKDQLIFDVGHQAYTHKILTGRKDQLKSLRQTDGLSGFLKPEESPHDIFGAGHASTSISAAFGLAYQKRLQGIKGKTLAIIGDGSFTGGLAFEALNIIGEKKEDVLVVLNDNKMSIDHNVGALNEVLLDLRTYQGYNRMKSFLSTHLPGFTKDKLRKMKRGLRHMLMPSNVFEGFGFKYYGPVDGHDLEALVKTFRKLQSMKGPMVVHVLTQKGKGYKKAEESPISYHGVGIFEPSTGMKIGPSENFSETFGQTLMAMAETNPKLVAITAAMPTGTGLKAFSHKYPNRFLDVGIAEENAVTSAAAMALGGLRPYVAIYSTFLQRGFDQLIHDVAIHQAPVVFCLDRAGIVGQDGSTHQGIYDIAYLSAIPGIEIWAPKDTPEFIRMLEKSQETDHPLAIRYPRDKNYQINEDQSDLSENEWLIRSEELENKPQVKAQKHLVISYGRPLKDLVEIAKDLNFDLYNHRIVFPLKEKIEEILDAYDKVIVVEEVVYQGSLSQKLQALRDKVVAITLPDAFIEHGDMHEILKRYGFSQEGLRQRIAHEISPR